MKIRLLFVFLLFSLPIAAIGQGKSLPGYVVLENNDTLSGFIHFRLSYVNPSVITFYQSSSENKRTFSAMELNGFGVVIDGEQHIYESFRVPKEGTTVFSSNPAPITEGDKKFLYVLIKGKPFSLYSYFDRIDQFYIQNEQGPLFELSNPARANQEMVKIEKYQKELAFLLGIWPEASRRIEGVRYEEKPIKGLIRDYNLHVNGEEANSYVIKAKKIEYQLGFIGGVTHYRPGFSSPFSDFDYLSKATTHSLPQATLGVFLNLKVSKWMPNLWVYNELAYRSLNARMEYDDKGRFYNYHHISNLNFNFLKMSNMVRWSPSEYVVNPFFQAGFWTSIVTKRDNIRNIKRYREEDENSTHESEEKMRGFSKAELGLSVGGGLSYKKYQTELRYERGTGLSNLRQVESSSSTLGLFLFYNLR